MSTLSKEHAAALVAWAELHEGDHDDFGCKGCEDELKLEILQLRDDKGCAQREALLCPEHEEMWLSKEVEGCGWCASKPLMTSEQVDAVRCVGRDEETRTTNIGLTELDALCDSHDKLFGVVDKINKLRNDAVGLQSCGISSFLYPLVAILGDAGIEGEGYNEARERINTIFTQRDEALKLLKLVWGHANHRIDWHDMSEEMSNSVERVKELIVQFNALKLQPELDKGEKELEKA